MANTIKTTTGEILVSEIESVSITPIIGLTNIVSKSAPVSKVSVTGKSGTSYDITSAIVATQAAKVYTAALNFIAGTGHQVFDASQVK